MRAVCSQFQLTLDDLNDPSIFVNWASRERKRVFRKILSGMTLAKLARKIKHDASALSEIKNGLVKPSGCVYLSLYATLGLKPNLLGLKISSRNSAFVKLVSLDISPTLMGLLHSDGILKKSKRHGIYCFFCNKERALIDNFKSLLRHSFDCQLFEFMDKRDNTCYVYPPSIIGRLLIRRFGEKKNLSPPLLSDREIPLYLTGLFDGDGTILLQKSGHGLWPRIRISMQNEIFANCIISLLRRIGIYSRPQFESSNGNKWWTVDIARKGDVLNFISKIGAVHPKKKSRMEIIKEAFKCLPARKKDTFSALRLACQ